MFVVLFWCWYWFIVCLGLLLVCLFVGLFWCFVFAFLLFVVWFAGLFWLDVYDASNVLDLLFCFVISDWMFASYLLLLV